MRMDSEMTYLPVTVIHQTARPGLFQFEERADAH